MGHQFRIFLTWVDLHGFQEKLLSKDTQILRNRSRGPFPSPVDSLDLIENSQRHFFFYLVRMRDLDFVRTREVKTQGYWTIDTLRSPVVEVTLSNLDGNTFRPGRFYYTDRFFDEHGNFVSKTLGFSEWAKKLLSKGKRLLTYDKDLSAYLGEEALQLSRKDVNFRGY